MSRYDLVLDSPSNVDMPSLANARPLKQAPPIANESLKKAIANWLKDQLPSIVNAIEHPVGETGNQGSEACLDLVTDTASTQNNPYSLANASSQNSASSLADAIWQNNAYSLANDIGHPVGETGDQGSEASLQLVTEIIDLLKDFTGG